jgi:elongator complex protein 1
MKYKINMDLKRYERAIFELSKGNNEQIERAVILAKQHHLYHYSLKLFQQNQEVVLKIKEALGEYLMGQKSYEMAGLIFESCNQSEKAFQAFKVRFHFSFF